MKNQRPEMPNALIALIMRLKRTGHSEDGFIIFITAALVMLLGFLWAASALVSKVDTANADASESTNTGFYAAEYGLNKRANDVRSMFEGYAQPSGTAPDDWDNCVSGSGNQGSGDMGCQTTTVSSSRNNRGSTKVATLMKPDPANPSQLPIPPGEPFAGLNALEYRYSVTSVAVNGNRLNQPAAVLGMDFKSRLIPLFQFAIFYNNDADFTIPPDMTINGRVHSNGSLYLNVQDSYTLSINGQVTASGVNPDNTINANPLIRGQKDNSTPVCGGTVRLMRDRGLGWQNLNCSDSSTRTRYNQTTTTPSNISDWGSNIQIGVPKLTVPAPGDFAPISGSTYWTNADLRVVLNVTNDSTNTNSRTRVTGIEVQNVDGTQNVTATAALNSCTAYDPTGTNIVQTMVTGSRTATQGAGTTTTDWIPITDSTGNRFQVGDAVIIGDGLNRDWNSNVLVGPVSSATDTALTSANTGTPLAANASTRTPITDPNLSSRIWSGAGNSLRLRAQVGNAINGSSPVMTNAVVRKAVVSSSDTFYNYREKYTASGSVTTGGTRGQYIRMLNVDMRELMNCAYNQPSLMGGKALNDATEGGLVWYFTVKDDAGNTNNFRKYAVRLYNGRYLAPSIPAAPDIKGLTVVSNQAVYVQGDYNLKDDNTTSPVSVADDPNTTRVESWKPAAILADTVNILSNRWQNDDFNGTVYSSSNLPEAQGSTFGKRLCVPSGTNPDVCTSSVVSQAQVDGQTHRPAPRQTWVNAAFLAGTFSPTSEGAAGTGGVNNYPRFHEHWNGTVPFNYRGSFVSLSQPSYTVAPFCGSYLPQTCNIYSPPVRNWDYESTAGLNSRGFDEAANLPPLSPRAVYLRQEVLTRSYKRRRDDRASINIFNPIAFLSSPALNLGSVMPGLR